MPTKQGEKTSQKKDLKLAAYANTTGERRKQQDDRIRGHHAIV
jgi:hypothetical protein